MACNAFTGGGAALQGLARRRFRGRHDCGGERGIRTPDTLAGTPDFESGAFSRSASSPETDASYPKHQNRRRKSAPPVRSAWHDVGGEGGIRTHDTFPYTRFPSVRLRPLGHLSYFLRWRKNPLRSAPHSSASTPLATSTRWFSLGSRRMSNSVSTAPAFGSATA